MGHTMSDTDGPARNTLLIIDVHRNLCCCHHVSLIASVLMFPKGFFFASYKYDSFCVRAFFIASPTHKK